MPPAKGRPHIMVLAGVNGAGKSSVGGAIIREHGLTWFNPDHLSRALMGQGGYSKDEADAEAWAYGRRRLEDAIAGGLNFAFETTLGGETIPRLIAAAATSHDILMIYCGLDSVDLHIDRVRLRVAHGGHDIPEERIRARWDSSRRNLIGLLPNIAHLQVYDNSRSARRGADIPPPVLVLEVKDGTVLHPAADDRKALAATPEWAKPIVAAAFRLHRKRRS